VPRADWANSVTTTDETWAHLACVSRSALRAVGRNRPRAQQDATNSRASDCHCVVSGTIAATVTPGAGDMTYYFQQGTTSGLTNVSFHCWSDAGSGPNPVAVTCPLNADGPGIYANAGWTMYLGSSPKRRASVASSMAQRRATRFLFLGEAQSGPEPGARRRRRLGITGGARRAHPLGRL
jgi:hypothetical protein